MKPVKKLIALAIVFVMIFTALPVGALAEEGAADTNSQFVIMSTTDTHGKVWDYDLLGESNVNNSLIQMAVEVQNTREAYANNTLLVDNGDLYQGTPVSSYQISQRTTAMNNGGDYNKPSPMAIALKYMDYDASILGNHEFNYSWNTMKEIYEYLKADNVGDNTALNNGVPVVCANLYYEGSGERVFPAYMTKTMQVDGHDFTILVIGLENTDCTRWDVPDNYTDDDHGVMTFGDPKNGPIEGKTNADTRDMVYEVNKALAEAEANGVDADFTMVVYHSGLGENVNTEGLVVGTNTEGQVLRIINRTTGIDMVVAGHDHSTSYSGNKYKNAEGEDVLVVNGGGTTLTKTVFEASYDAATDSFTVSQVTTGSHNVSFGSSSAKDETLKALIAPYAEDAQEYVQTKVGTLAGSWDRVRGSNTLYVNQSDTIDLIGRAQIYEGGKYLAEKYETVEALNAKLLEIYPDGSKQYHGDEIVVDMSSTSVVVNGSNGATEGDLTIAGIYKFYRYDNSLYLLALTGQEIKDMLEFNATNRISARIVNGNLTVSPKGDSDANFTHPVFYGLNFTYDMYQPEGSRAVIEGFSNGKKFDLNETYIFAINNYHLGNSGNTELAKYSTAEQLWSQTDDLGGGTCQDMIASYVGRLTEEDGGVYSNSAYDKETGLNGNGEPVSHWSVSYSGDLDNPPVEEIPDGTKYIADYVEDPNTLEDGDTVIIYNPGNYMIVTNAASGSRLAASEDAIVSGTQLGTNTDAALFTVEKAEDGHVLFVDADGKVMTSGEAGNSMTMADDKTSELAHWTFEDQEGGVYVHNEGAVYQGNTNQYLEYYSGFTTYGLNGGGAAYLTQFYKYTAKPDIPVVHEHTLTAVAAKDATCTEAGNIAYWFCAECGKYFSDADATTEITLAETVISALGHDWGEWNAVYIPTNLTNGLEERVCKRCDTAETRKTDPVADFKLKTEFTDLDMTLWYNKGVTFAIANGLMIGTGDDTFEPATSMTRGMLATIIYRIHGKPSIDGLTNPFTDVEDGQYYTEAVIWAANAKIVNGIGGDKFAPDDIITRQDFTVILYRAIYGEREWSAPESWASYKDTDQVSDYAVNALHWAVGTGIIEGDVNLLSPLNNASRAEGATILYRYLIG